MTPRPVRRLPDALVNRIAAGEVVERPASVVKELLENSLDAGARRVTVTLRGAGRRLVAVADDGHGMTPADCLLAVQRHATSKLTGEADLEAIQTLGFRGEALAAIFAVSRFRLVSRARGAPRAFLLLGQGGTVEETGELDAPEGTTVEVRELFFNAPARARFLKTPQTEQAAVLRTVTQLALAHPEVELRLDAGGRPLLAAPAAVTLRERVGALYGPALAARLLEVEAETDGVRVAGLAGPPELARSHREDLHLSVNGRPVRDTLLAQAVVDAYRPLLPRDQFPLVVLHVAVDPGEVDVNVHPAKAWVRFRRPGAVAALVGEAVATALRRGPGAAGSPGPPPAGVGSTDLGSRVPANAGLQGALFREATAGYGTPLTLGRPLGQIEDTLIVAYTAEEVFFVDQHVAHERVLFERLRAELAAGAVASQELLLPRPLELAPARRDALRRAEPVLARLGFALEDFGGGALLLRAVPALLRDAEPERLADELARDLDEGGSPAGSPVLDRVLAFVACRAAVKAGQSLGPDEMARLLKDLAATEMPWYCPHGRPVVSRIPLREIRRELRRDW